MSPYIAAFIFLSTLTSLLIYATEKSSTQHDAVTTMLHFWDGIGQVMSGAWFHPDIQAKEFNLCVIKPENFVSYSLEVLQEHFDQHQVGCHVITFTEMVVLLGGSLHRATLQL